MDNTPKQPLLSIIIPVYNLKEYIPICLESIYSQRIRNDLFEVVIVDDGSKDDSWNVINHYTQIYDNIKAIRQVNAGVSAARNRGVEECSSDYLTFLDADDEFHPKSLNSIFSLMEKYKDADVFYFQSFIKSSDGKYKRVNDWDGRYKENVKYSSKALLYKNSFLNGGCVWGCVYSHSFFINNRLTFAEGIVNNEDSIFNYRLLSKSPVVRFASIPFYLVTEREGSASRSDSIERVIGYAKNMEYALKMHSEGVDKFEKQVADACLYNTISAATNMFLNIGEREWKKLFDILSIASLHKLYVPWFPLNQKLKILLINISFRLYFSILVRKMSTNK